MSFPANSRYRDIKTAVLTSDSGEPIIYLCRRFIPAPALGLIVGEHIVQDGERLDHLAARYLGDPELFWKLCDTNSAMRPEDLTDEAGQSILIPLM